MHKPTTHHKARLVMRDAWRIARRAQPIYGGSVRSYLAEALREAWAALKADPLTTAVDQIIAGIKSRPQPTTKYCPLRWLDPSGQSPPQRAAHARLRMVATAPCASRRVMQQYSNV